MPFPIFADIKHMFYMYSVKVKQQGKSSVLTVSGIIKSNTQLQSTVTDSFFAFLHSYMSIFLLVSKANITIVN